MYEIALSVQACVHAGTHVDVAWLVGGDGTDVDSGTEALALTPGGGRIGGLLGGVLDDQVADLVAAGPQRRLVELTVGPVEALVGGLPQGMRVSAVLMPADGLPVDLWEVLRRREPVGLVLRLDGMDVVGADVVAEPDLAAAGEDVAGLFGRQTSGTKVDDNRLSTLFWPVPRLVVVGRGPVPDALGAAAALLGWQVRTVTDVSSARGLVAGLAGLDRVVVAAHDVEVAGPALAAALESGAGYIGSVGSRRMQAARGDWLAYQGVTDLTRVHGPAGLDIGAITPAEIAVSILAEALAVGTGSAVARRDEPT